MERYAGGEDAACGFKFATEDLDGAAPRRQLSIDRRAIELNPCVVRASDDASSFGDDSSSSMDGFRAVPVKSAARSWPVLNTHALMAMPPPREARSLLHTHACTHGRSLATLGRTNVRMDPHE